MLGAIQGRTSAHSQPHVLSRCVGPAVIVVVLLAGGYGRGGPRRGGGRCVIWCACSGSGASEGARAARDDRRPASSL